VSGSRWGLCVHVSTDQHHAAHARACESTAPLSLLQKHLEGGVSRLVNCLDRE
jgi:hypothetical protein